uniref:Uncharacterized protein n=1 Tax=Capitella teleta TaxID=283909 RepID=X2AD95_CAPTE
MLSAAATGPEEAAVEVRMFAHVNFEVIQSVGGVSTEGAAILAGAQVLGGHVTRAVAFVYKHRRTQNAAEFHDIATQDGHGTRALQRQHKNELTEQQKTIGEESRRRRRRSRREPGSYICKQGRMLGLEVRSQQAFPGVRAFTRGAVMSDALVNRLNMTPTSSKLFKPLAAEAA